MHREEQRSNIRRGRGTTPPKPKKQVQLGENRINENDVLLETVQHL